jgi:photosystem II stability/assembly factor-like uncharacterized protein
LYISFDYGITWTEARPAGDVNKTWNAVAVSADGGTFLAGVYSGTSRLYSSTDGVNWTERQPAGAVNKSWAAAALDEDGSFMIVAAYNGRLYTSIDGGANWTERRPKGNVNARWQAVACDEDGTNLMASEDTGRFYISNDGGVTWIEKQLLGDRDNRWFSVAMSRDGQTMIASSTVVRGLFISTDAGVTWANLHDGAAGYVNVSVSDDCGVILLGTDDDAYEMQISWDGGTTWETTMPSGLPHEGSWFTCSVSGDGTQFAAGNFPLRFYAGVIVAAAAFGQVIMVNDFCG